MTNECDDVAVTITIQYSQRRHGYCQVILSGTHAPFHNSTAFKNNFKDALMYLVNVGVDCTTICHNLVTLQQYFLCYYCIYN